MKDTYGRPYTKTESIGYTFFLAALAGIFLYGLGTAINAFLNFAQWWNQ